MDVNLIPFYCRSLMRVILKTGAGKEVLCFAAGWEEKKKEL
jgi:hypothetical protein